MQGGLCELNYNSHKVRKNNRQVPNNHGTNDWMIFTMVQMTI